MQETCSGFDAARWRAHIGPLVASWEQMLAEAPASLLNSVRPPPGGDIHAVGGQYDAHEGHDPIGSFVQLEAAYGRALLRVSGALEMPGLLASFTARMHAVVRQTDAPKTCLRCLQLRILSHTVLVAMQAIDATLESVAATMSDGTTLSIMTTQHAGAALVLDAVPDEWEALWEGPDSASEYCR